MSALVGVLREFTRDTGGFRVNNRGATELAEALADVGKLVEAARALLNKHDRYDSPEIAALWDAVNRVGGAA